MSGHQVDGASSTSYGAQAATTSITVRNAGMKLVDFLLLTIIFIKKKIESSLKGDIHRKIAGPKVRSTFWPLTVVIFSRVGCSDAQISLSLKASDFEALTVFVKSCKTSSSIK